MNGMRHYVMTFKKRRLVCAEIDSDNSDADRRTLAAASLLAGERVGSCVVASLAGSGKVYCLATPDPRGSAGIDSAPIEALISRCKRLITSAQIDVYLNPALWPPLPQIVGLPFQPELFETYA